MFVKKIISCFLIFILSFINTSPVFASETSWLFSIKKTDISKVKSIVDFYARQNNMPEVSGNAEYTFVLSSSLENDFWIATYEKEGENVCLFVYSPSDKNSVIKDLKIRFNKNNLKYSKLRSKTLISLKKQNAEKFLQPIIQNKNLKNTESFVQNTNYSPIVANNTNGVIDGYDFSDEAQAKFDAGLIKNTASSNPQQFNPQNAYHVENIPKNEQKNQMPNIQQGNISPNQTILPNNNILPTGITLIVSLQSSVNTASFDEKDCLSGTLKENVRFGNVIIPAGSLVYGSATSANKAGSAFRNGDMTIKFDRILSLDGKEYSFKSSPIEFKNTDSGMSRTAKVSSRVVAATLAGIALAALTGAICQTDNWGRTLTVGAASGAVSGGLSLIGANGEDVEIKEGSVFTVITE